jgi:hypothetical protein
MYLSVTAKLLFPLCSSESKKSVAAANSAMESEPLLSRAEGLSHSVYRTVYGKKGTESKI